VRRRPAALPVRSEGRPGGQAFAGHDETFLIRSRNSDFGEEERCSGYSPLPRVFEALRIPIPLDGRSRAKGEDLNGIRAVISGDWPRGKLRLERDRDDQAQQPPAESGCTVDCHACL
jgi:hypothetical protein